MGMEKLLSVHELGKSYGPRVVLRSIELDVVESQVVLVVGPNGAGKSTLLKIMAGGLSPTRGWVERFIPGEHIAYMGHKTFLYPRLSALENIRFWARMFHLEISEEKAKGLLAHMGLGHVMHEMAGYFSRGMAQRLNLARVILQDPRIFFLDEPSTGLDQESRRLLRREISNAREKGKSIVWVSHDLDKDKDRADTILALDKGIVTFQGAVNSYSPETSC